MIRIRYTNDSVEGEPGPNFYWEGKPDDFLNLIVEIHSLGKSPGTTIDIGQIPFVEVLGEYAVTARSSDNGVILNRRDNGAVLMDLDSSVWRLILEIILRISFYPSHEYIDFEELKLSEEANFIISSEG